LGLFRNKRETTTASDIRFVYEVFPKKKGGGGDCKGSEQGEKGGPGETWRKEAITGKVFK